MVFPTPPLQVAIRLKFRLKQTLRQLLSRQRWEKTNRKDRSQAATIHFTAALDVNNDLQQKQYQKYNRHISDKIAKWANKVDVQIKSAASKQFDTFQWSSSRTMTRLLSKVTAFMNMLQCVCFHVSFENQPVQICHTLWQMTEAMASRKAV